MATAQDATRQEAIAAYGLVDDLPETDLEGLVQLAATVCHVPTAVINIIDDRFQHQVAAVGFSASVCSREDSMCAVVFQHPGHVVVSDARRDPRFANNPFVTGVIANVRFYASSPIVTPDGIPIGTLCVFDEQTGDLSEEDSTALALIAHQIVEVLELRRLSRELERSNEELESFAAQVSHDLRNPLTALAGFIELAADSPELADAPEAAHALARAESAADRMNAMISNLLDYARIGGSRPREDDVELEHVVAAVLDDLAATIAESRATVTADAAVTVTGDVTLVRVLLQNLVANAIKFTAASGIDPRVEVRAHELAKAWRITVGDNGPGVPVEQRERVFDLMERGSAHAVPGLGIGLSTCKRIVESMGGSIRIGDSPLGGAEVRIVLPKPPDPRAATSN